MVYTVTFTSGKEFTFFSNKEIENIIKQRWLKMDNNMFVNVKNIETIKEEKY